MSAAIAGFLLGLGIGFLVLGMVWAAKVRRHERMRCAWEARNAMFARGVTLEIRNAVISRILEGQPLETLDAR